MLKAKVEEACGLIYRGTFQALMTEDIPSDANILQGRLVLSITSTEDGSKSFKKRLVVGGHREKMKKLMVRSSQKFQPVSIRLLLSLAATNRFYVWNSDFKQAYLQSEQQLRRTVYI